MKCICEAIESICNNIMKSSNVVDNYKRAETILVLTYSNMVIGEPDVETDIICEESEV